MNPVPVYQVFGRIDDALAFRRQQHPHTSVFSRDRPNPTNPGSKCYVVATLPALFERMQRTECTRRNYYEIVVHQEPCHLYIDCEYQRSQSPLIANEREHNRVFLEELRQFLVQEIKCRGDATATPPLDPWRDIQVLTLQSVTMRLVTQQQCDDNSVDDQERVRRGLEQPDKRSKHWIVKVRGHMFQDNFHCGALMRRFARHMHRRFGAYDQNPYFLSKSGEFYADMSVYTRNRNFRTCYASKYQDYRPLLPCVVSDTPASLRPGCLESVRYLRDDDNDDRDDTPTKRQRTHILQVRLCEETFLEHLVQRRDVASPVLIRMHEYDGSSPTGTSNLFSFLAEHPGRVAAETSSSSSSGSNRGRDDTAVAGPAIVSGFGAPLQRLVAMVQQHYGSAVAGTIVPGCKSPQQGVSIVRWYPATNSVIVNSGWRVCQLAGREHRGNHIYFVVNVLHRQYRQRCHDGECAGKRSQTYSVDALVTLDQRIDLARAALEHCIVNARTAE